MEDALSTERGGKRPRGITQAEWKALLAALHADLSQATAAYETARDGLISILTARGLTQIEAELGADKSIDITARRLAEKSGTSEPVADILAFMRGVARKVASGMIKDRHEITMENIPEPRCDPRDRNLEERDAREDRLALLDDAVSALPEKDRMFILAYYRGRGVEKISRRAGMAEISNRSAGALRIHAYRIRMHLRAMIEERMRGSTPGETNWEDGH